MSFYSISETRYVSLCNPHIHHQPAAHPTRTMKEHDMIYCAEGRMPVILNNTEYILHKDDFLILHGGIEHRGSEKCDADTKLYFIHASVCGGDAFTSDQISPPDGCVTVNGLTSCAGHEEIKHLMKEIINNYWKRKQNDESRLSLLCNLLILRVSEINQGENTREEDFSLAEKCRDLIIKNHNRILTAKELCENFYVSERTLRNAFIERFGMTPMRFQRELKLQRSLALLKEYPDLSIGEIADSLGFEYETHFNLQFKKRFGVPPRELRKKIAEGYDVPITTLGENEISWVDWDSLQPQNQK